jgi:hypothetical protein
MSFDVEATKAKFPKLYEDFNKGDFSDVVLQSWCIIELCFNNVILRVYRVSSQDAKSKPLLRFPFREKLKLFKELKLVSTSEYQTLTRFSQKRNEIVHKIGGGMFYIEDSEKKEIMTNAVNSALIAHSIFVRAFDDTKV